MTRRGKTEHNSNRAAGRLLRVKMLDDVPLTSVGLPPPNGDKGLYNESWGSRFLNYDSS